MDSNKNKSVDRNSLESINQNICYTGFWFRALALLIDLGLICSFIIGSVYTYPLNFLGAFSSDYILCLIIFVSISYFVVLDASKWQGTIGKKILHIKIIDQDGGRVSIYKSLVRFLCPIISVISFVGWVMTGFTKRKQALHDKLCSTLVIEDESGNYWIESAQAFVDNICNRKKLK